MCTKLPTFSRAKRWAIVVALLAVMIGAASYGSWGYERHLAVESFPVAKAEINPESQFAIQYRKRFNWLPGAQLMLVAADHTDVAALRGEAITAYDWSVPDLRGTTYCFVRDFDPLPGWAERDPNAKSVTRDLN